MATMVPSSGHSIAGDTNVLRIKDSISSFSKTVTTTEETILITATGVAVAEVIIIIKIIIRDERLGRTETDTNHLIDIVEDSFIWYR